MVGDCLLEVNVGQVEHHQVVHFAQRVFRVVLQKSIPTQIRQLILYARNSKGRADGFGGGVTSAKRLQKHFA